MDLELQIKEEPVLQEQGANTSLDSYINNNVHNERVVKVEYWTSHIPKVENEAIDTRSDDQRMMPAADIKDEIVIEEHTVDQLAPSSKEGNNVNNFPSLNKGPVSLRDIFCKPFTQRSNLDCDLVTKDDNSYVCPLCNNKFTFKGDIEAHLLTHSGERAFRCWVCDRIFCEESKLKIHLRSHYGVRPFSCTLCNSSFARKSTLKNHMFTHSGKWPHSCLLCGSGFACKANLKIHMLTHTGTRSGSFVCSACDKKFNEKGTLRKHMFTHSGEKPYSCNECLKKFSQKSQLGRHTLIHLRKQLNCTEEKAA